MRKFRRETSEDFTKPDDAKLISIVDRATYDAFADVIRKGNKERIEKYATRFIKEDHGLVVSASAQLIHGQIYISAELKGQSEPYKAKLIIKDSPDTSTQYSLPFN